VHIISVDAQTNKQMWKMQNYHRNILACGGNKLLSSLYWFCHWISVNHLITPYWDVITYLFCYCLTSP